MKEKFVLMMIKWILNNHGLELDRELMTRGIHLHFNPKKKAVAKVKIVEAKTT